MAVWGLSLVWLGCGDAELGTGGNGAPTCPEGQVLRGDRCGPEAGSPCDIVEDHGGCAEGFACDPELGCVPEEGLDQCAPDGTCAGGDVCQQGICVDPDEDNDNDGVDAGDDCNDFEAGVGQCAEDEECVDGQCGRVGEDGDGDGVAFPDDCNDRDPEVFAGHEELCNGIDDDCDGVIDPLDLCPDDDGDGFQGCDEVRDPFRCDCDDANPAVNPGRIDVCGPDGAGVGGADCNPREDACGPGSACCAGEENCVDIRYNEANCGTCGTTCGAGEFCANGACLSEAGGVERAPGDDGVVNPSALPQQYPAIAFNYNTIWSWYGAPWSWWWHFFEYGYGIAWVEDVGNNGVVFFTARHFNLCPLDWRGFFPGSFFDFPSVEIDDDLETLLPTCGFGFLGDFYAPVQVASLRAESAVVSIAPGGDLGFGLAWSDTPAGSSQIFFGNLTHYGFPGGANTPITSGLSNAERPALAWSPWFFVFGEGFGVAYEDDQTGAKQIWFRRVDSFWSYWSGFGAAVQVSDDEIAATAASIAWSPAGFGVIWVGAGTGDIYFASVSELGIVQGAPVRVTTGAQVAGTRTGLVYNDDAGEFAAVFEGSPEGQGENEEIYFLRMDTNGTLVGTTLRVTELETNQNAPTLAWTGEDYGVTWYDSRFAGDEHPEVVFARVSRDGDEVIEELRVTDHGGNGRAMHPSIAYGWAEQIPIGFLGEELIGRGEFALVWDDRATDDSPEQIHFTRFVRQ